MLEEVQRRRLRLPETGIEIATLDWGGEGPLALLHHANGFCAGCWGLVAEGLRDRFRLVAMDARGQGDSTGPPERGAYDWHLLCDDLVAVAEQLLAETGRDRIALGLGHSFGGTLTLAAAARRPRLYERILLVDPVIRPPDPVDLARMERGAALAERARKRRHVWPTRAEARAYFAERELFAAWDPRALDLYVAEGLRDRDDGQVELKCRGEVESWVFQQSGSLDPFAVAAGVRVPALLLWAREGSFPRGAYQALAEKMEDARVDEVEAGHLVPMERPALVVEAALRFVRAGISEAAGSAARSTGR